LFRSEDVESAPLPEVVSNDSTASVRVHNGRPGSYVDRLEIARIGDHAAVCAHEAAIVEVGHLDGPMLLLIPHSKQHLSGSSKATAGILSVCRPAGIRAQHVQKARTAPNGASPMLGVDDVDALQATSATPVLRLGDGLRCGKRSKAKESRRRPAERPRTQ